MNLAEACCSGGLCADRRCRKRRVGARSNAERRARPMDKRFQRAEDADRDLLYNLLGDDAMTLDMLAGNAV